MVPYLANWINHICKPVKTTFDYSKTCTRYTALFNGVYLYFDRIQKLVESTQLFIPVLNGQVDILAQCELLLWC